MKKNVVELGTTEQAMPSVLINSVVSTIRRKLNNVLYGVSPDGKRDYNTVYGYEKNLCFSNYKSMYERGGIANTVVAKVAKACWRDIPTLTVGDDNNTIAGDEIVKLKNTGLFNAFERADILNRIGQYSVLFIGVQDENEFRDPICNGGEIEDLYFNIYNEDGIEIVEWDTDPVSERYGLPIRYQLQIVDLDTQSKLSPPVKPVIVHYTRVVHLAEGSLENPIVGSSALQPVWDALIDKNKVRGGAAEAFFRNALQKFGLIADKEASFDNSTEGKAALEDEVEAFSNNMKSFMRLKNMDLQPIQPAIASPREAFDVAVEEISGQTGIPIRILTGKGGGQLAGNEDKSSWNALINDRQNQQCSKWLMRAFEILVESNVISPLPENVVINWPVQKSLNEIEEAEVSDKQANALEKIARATMTNPDIVLTSALDEVGLNDIEVDESELTIGE